MSKQENPAELTAQPGTEIATLPPAERAVIVLNSKKAETHLLELVERTKPLEAPVDAAGREQVHRAAMEHKNARVAIQNASKTAREDATAFGKAMIAEEKRLVAINSAEEERLFELRDTYDSAAKLAKEAAERKERERIAAIQIRMQAIKNLPVDSTSDTADQLAATLADLREYEITFEDFAEFQDEATTAREQSIGNLSKMHELAVAREAAAKAAAEAEAQLAAQREEIERQKREIAEQQVELARERAELEQRLSGVTDVLRGAEEKSAPKEKALREDIELDERIPEALKVVTAAELERLDFDAPRRHLDENTLIVWGDVGAGPDTQVEQVIESARTMTVEPEAPATTGLPMRAFFFQFEPTGVHEVDMILSAIAQAGSRAHHTEDWTEETSAPQPHAGATPVEWIQKAADQAAQRLTKLHARDAWLSCLEQAGVDNWDGIEEALRLRREDGV